MSAELLFDIYTTKLTDSNNTSQDTSYKRMWELATMMDENSLLEKMLTKQLDEKLEKELMNELSKICITNDDEIFSAMEKEVFYKCGKYAEEIFN